MTQEKKSDSYKKPTLKVYGNIKEITKSGGQGGPDGGTTFFGMSD